MIVAIDGPAGAGKSTIARQFAQQEGFQYLDSGAFYRCYACAALDEGLNLNVPQGLKEFLQNQRVEADYSKDSPTYTLNGEDVTRRIRSNEISQLVSKVASLGEVRDEVVKRLREVSHSGNFIVDGRDIGTVVFPDAELKFFLTASIEERAQRRYLELKGKGEEVPLATLQEQIRRRDEADSKRVIAPLSMAQDAILIDSSDLNVKQVIDVMSQHLNADIHHSIEANEPRQS